MKSDILYNFDDFIDFMIQCGWSKTYIHNETNTPDKPSTYPCICINHYYMDYDNRLRDHLTIIELQDFFDTWDIRAREYAKKEIKRQEEYDEEED